MKTTLTLNRHKSINLEKSEPFEIIDSKTIERFYINYKNSNGQEKYRYAVLGIWTVDLKELLMKKSDNLGQVGQHRIVKRHTTIKRNRVDDSRFNSQIYTGYTEPRNMIQIDGEEPSNWLGETWM